MLKVVGVENLDDLFEQVPRDIRFAEPPDLPEELSYDALQERLASIAAKNSRFTSFLGDGIPDWEVHPITAHVCNIRPLTTSYTPYQPERSQGTLVTHWIYQCVMSALTGFEAVNSSLYDRSTALFEAICCSLRLSRGRNTVIVAESLFPSDLEVLRTHVEETKIQLVFSPIDPLTGRLDLDALRTQAEEIGDDLAAIAYPQINSLGLLEDVDALTDLAHSLGTKAIACVDPMLLAGGGLKPPVDFGQNGADLLVGEAQHLAIGPNFGGPGLGLFGVRHNQDTRNDVRSTPGRFVGKAVDHAGRECRVMVLSTREQHIRKERATSNVCSNQAFLATIVGAAVLGRGETGLRDGLQTARQAALETCDQILGRDGIALAFPETPFFNEIVLETSQPSSELIARAREKGLHLGIEVSERIPGNRQLLKISFSDKSKPEACQQLVSFFEEQFPAGSSSPGPQLPQNYLREGTVGLPDLPEAEIRSYYECLGALNVSPDSGCYPLGSCTMKYNPFVNDWAASLPGFTDAHPQAPIEDVQGCLEILFEIQGWFKKITGLAAVTTQPVAGAQGELVGIKLFQAYHRDRGDSERDIIFIPKSAHGTNFATAVTAGFSPANGIVHLEALPDGRIDPEYLDAKLEEHGARLCGVMITNPNTSGVFETEFKAIADKIHAAGGLVYMDGANMNAIAGWVDLGAMGVDAVHNNLHKTWTIPHGGGGPGDAIVAVSERLVDFLPGHQFVREDDGLLRPIKPSKSIGSFHRHWGNFAHKVRAFAYLLRLGREGVPRMSAVAVLSSRYLYELLRSSFPTLPAGAAKVPRMHEFILTLEEETFAAAEAAGVPRSKVIPQIGKLFLDFGFHAPTVAFPEIYGLMIEPTESYSKSELDRFAEAVLAIRSLIDEHPEILTEAPYFTPIDRVDEVSANRNLILHEKLDALPELPQNRLSPDILQALPISEIRDRIIKTSAK
jgi:glycine dehydrogenase